MFSCNLFTGDNTDTSTYENRTLVKEIIYVHKFENIVWDVHNVNVNYSFHCGIRYVGLG